MKNIVKNSFYATVGVALSGVATANAAITSGDADGALKGSTKTLPDYIESIVTFLLGFLALLALLYALYGGFNILTAGGDEEKVKKGKTILIQAVLGLVVIFIANSVVVFVIGGLNTAAS